MKQETFEEASKRIYSEDEQWTDRHIFILGAKWQQEDILDLLKVNGYEDEPIFDLITEQFKKK